MRYFPQKEFIFQVGRVLANTGQKIKTKKWQGVEAPEMFEALFVGVQTDMVGDQLTWKENIKPNLPWADDHFNERVCGIPLNPGEQYKNWPFYGRDKEMRNQDDKFTHTYMERFWPKFAGKVNSELYVGFEELETAMGIRYQVGDYNDLLNHLYEDPYSRQAFLPIWFPEDTGVVHGGRVPCTLGYHFILRNGFLHMTYYIRSCDYLRHFNDDVYMAFRLANNLIEQLKLRSYKGNLADGNPWENVKLGRFRMDIISLHVFAQEYSLLAKKYK